MRKILSFLTISLLVFFSACDMNQVPEFDDSDAFVAFDQASMSVSEEGGTLSIPVTLASVKGKSATVNYSIVDGTAKLGENFTIAGETSLTFDASNRTQFIEVSIIDKDGVFTGDLSFKIQLSEDGTVKPSAESVCSVTIQDQDHPLSSFLGTWSGTADSYYFGDGVKWDVTLEKDPDDVTVLWITDVIYGFPNYGFSPPTYDTRFYATVSEDKTEIRIPIGQTCAYQYQGNDIFLYGLTADGSVVESGNVVGTLSEDGTTITFDELGIYVSDATGGWDVLWPGIVWTK